MAENPVENTHNGVKKKGDWDEITEFAEEVGEALGDSEVEEDSVENFDDWRPRKEDDKVEVAEKTVEAATVSERKIEEKTNGVKNDIGEASEKLTEAGRKVVENENPNKEIKDASKTAARPFVSRTVGVLRWVEETIYSKIMLRFNDYYFDSKDVAVDMKDEDNGEYQMDVKVPEDEKREQVQEKMRDEDK